MAVLKAVVLLASIGILVSADQLVSPEGSSGSRIVSGWEAQERQFPYVMYLRAVHAVHGQVNACAGSIIHNNWGLSSASCVAQRRVLYIRMGSVDINRPREYLESTTFFTAPEYIDELQAISQPHDIGLIRFSRFIAYNEFIQPIRLMRSADKNRDYAGVRLTTSGWGTTWTAGSTTDILNWVHLTGITNFVCLLLTNSNFMVRESTICATRYNVTSQGICAGDSGVALTAVDVDSQLTQVGVGSFASQFGCHVGMPSGFVRPGHYHDWIRQVTGINFDWGPSAADDVQLSADSRDSPLKILKLTT